MLKKDLFDTTRSIFDVEKGYNMDNSKRVKVYLDNCAYKKELYSRGMRGLRELLGSVDAEEFIALVKSEQFDYTQWQRRHFDAKTPEQISREAREYAKQHPFRGNPDALV